VNEAFEHLESGKARYRIVLENGRWRTAFPGTET